MNSTDCDSKNLENVNLLRTDLKNSVDRSSFYRYHNGFNLPENQTFPATTKCFDPALVINSEESHLHIENNLRDHQLVTDKLIFELKKSNDQINKLEKCLLAKQSSVNELSIELDRKTALINSLTSESSKKDILLRQLDSTLGRLTRGWKDHEVQQELALKLAKEAENRKIKEVEQLKNQYQTDRAQWDEELNSIKAEYRLEKISLEEQLSQMTTKCKELEGYNTESYQTIEELKCRLQNNENTFQEYQLKLTEQQQTLQSIMKKCVKFKEYWQNQLKQYKDFLRKNFEMKKDELFKLKEKISTVMKAYEVEFQEYQKQIDLAAEQRIREKLIAYEQKMQENTIQAEENLRNKLQEASDRYRADLDQLRLNAETELSRQMSENEHRIEVERNRVQIAEKQCEHWRIRTREAEEARSALALQINELLQARCVEAMQMLRSSSTTTPLNVPVTHDFTSNTVGLSLLTDSEPISYNLNKGSSNGSESEEEEQDQSTATVRAFETQLLSSIDLNKEGELNNNSIQDAQKKLIT
ncbi:cellular myosin heavy chain [Schistosoma japonicum]|nr:cellular myosin heavy chain [Schistosoma japonicum]